MFLSISEVLPYETLAALYADDTKVYKFIKLETHCLILQYALTSLDCWSCDNNLDFNHMGLNKLLRVDKEKDLGFQVSANEMLTST